MDETLREAWHGSHVLVLYTELMGYTAATFEALARLVDCRIIAVHKDRERTREFAAQGSSALELRPRSGFDRTSLQRLFEDLKPRLLYVAGWGDPDYLAVARAARRSGIPVVTGMDNQWRGSLRQRLACVFSRFRIKPYFSHIQVAGVRQYEFARRLGFAPERILFNVYSADTSLFGAILSDPAREVRASTRRILFVGRFHPSKGLDLLERAWKEVGVDSGWELVVIGNGTVGGDLTSLSGVTVKSFLQPAELAEEAARAQVLVLPSRHEPWGVVVHEFAAAGLALVLSSACGAATEFLIPGYNGFSFENGDSADLARVLTKLFGLDEAELRLMGERSRVLASRISSETAAANLWSATIL